MRLLLSDLPRFWDKSNRRVRYSKKQRSYRIKGDSLRDARRFDEAANAYGAYLEHVSDDFDIWVQKGNCLKEAGQLTQAKAAYDSALQLRPDDADLYLQMGHLAKVTGDFPKALVAYRKSTEVAPSLEALAELQSIQVLLSQGVPGKDIPEATLSHSPPSTAKAQSPDVSQGTQAIKRLTLLPTRFGEEELEHEASQHLRQVKRLLYKHSTTNGGAAECV